MKQKLERCGWCGSYNVSSLRELQEYTQKEQSEADLYDCGCHQEQYKPTYREMYEQGIISKSEYDNL